MLNIHNVLVLGAIFKVWQLLMKVLLLGEISFHAHN